MSNLIPQFAKKKVATEYWLRVVTTWFVLWGVALLIGTIFLFPMYIYTSVQIDVNSESAKSAEASVASFEDVAFDLQKASIQARNVIQNERRTKAFKYVELVERNFGLGTQLNSVAFSSDANGISQINVQGEADSREALASLRDRFIEEPAIASANLPISNLAQESDIAFTITITMSNDIAL